MTQKNKILPPTKKLVVQVQEKICFKHYRSRTEKSYISRIKHQTVFNGKHHPADRGVVEVEGFLAYLDNQHHVSSATQNQANRPSYFHTAMCWYWICLTG